MKWGSRVEPALRAGSDKPARSAGSTLQIWVAAGENREFAADFSVFVPRPSVVNDAGLSRRYPAG